MEEVYYSALRINKNKGVDLSKYPDIPEGSVYRHDRVTLIRHDATKELPAEFNRCDVLYSELAAWDE